MSEINTLPRARQAFSFIVKTGQGDLVGLLDIVSALKEREGTPSIIEAFGHLIDDIEDQIRTLLRGRRPVTPLRDMSPSEKEKSQVRMTLPEGGRATVCLEVQLDGAVGVMAQIERALYLQVLQMYNGNKSRTARALGISVRALANKIKAWKSRR